MDRQPAVVIIGAGAAGLSAARLLSRAGIDVAIVEARERIGGRIHTLCDPLSPVPIELGAEFIHGRPPEIWQAVTGRLPVFELKAEQWFVHDGKPERSDDESELVSRVLEPLARAPEQSFLQFLDSSMIDPAMRGWALGYVQGFHAARPELLSVEALAQVEAAGRRSCGDHTYRFERGYSAFVEWLYQGADASHVRTHFGTVVDSIRWRRGHVEVAAHAFGRPMRLHAPRAIVTVPLGVLQAKPGDRGAIQFDPDPPVLRAARESLAMGHAARVTLRFRRPVWEDRPELRNAGFVFSDQDWMPTWWTSLPVRVPVLTGWTGGPAAEIHSQEDSTEWMARTLRALARLLRTDETTLASELEACHTHNWSADPFSRGAYSYVRVGGREAQRCMGEPLESTLYFAGEATESEGHAGTVHGAVASGVRAARQILH